MNLKNLTNVSEAARLAVEVGERNHYWFRVVGEDEMPKEPVYKDGWWFCPQAECNLPLMAKQRVKALRKAGLNPTGFVVAHETPKLLTAPPREVDWGRVKRVAKDTGKVIGVATLTAVGVTLITALAAAGALLVGLVLIDPCICVVLADGTWIEILRWDE
jgi:hypothetical protein